MFRTQMEKSMEILHSSRRTKVARASERIAFQHLVKADHFPVSLTTSDVTLKLIAF